LEAIENLCSGAVPELHLDFGMTKAEADDAGEQSLFSGKCQHWLD
jgi:hypothetical protein